MSYQKRCDIFNEYPDVLQVRDVQIMLGVSRHQVYKLIESGRIRGIKLGKACKIPKVKLIEYLLNEPVGIRDD